MGKKCLNVIILCRKRKTDEPFRLGSPLFNLFQKEVPQL